MEEIYRLIEEKIALSGYNKKISGEEIYDDLCDQIDGKENGEYILLSKTEDDVVLVYKLTIMDEDFNLSELIIKEDDKEYKIDFDK